MNALFWAFLLGVAFGLYVGLPLGRQTQRAAHTKSVWDMHGDLIVGGRRPKRTGMGRGW